MLKNHEIHVKKNQKCHFLKIKNQRQKSPRKKNQRQKSTRILDIGVWGEEIGVLGEKLINE